MHGHQARGMNNSESWRGTSAGAFKVAVLDGVPLVNAVPLENPLLDAPENGIVLRCELDRVASQFSGSKRGPNSLGVHQQQAVVGAM